MPRKVVTRKWLGVDVAKDDPRIAAIREFLIDGDRLRACATMRAINAPPGNRLAFFLDARLAELWKEHRDEVRREAKRRGAQAWGERFETWTGTEFAPTPAQLAARAVAPRREAPAPLNGLVRRDH